MVLAELRLQFGTILGSAESIEVLQQVQPARYALMR
jgi:hypothetical protein